MSLSRPLPGEFDPAYGAYLAEAPEGDVLALLEAQGREIQALYGGLGKGQGNHRYAPGKWSLKDLLLHLTDAERIFAYRCLRIGRGDETPLPGFDEEAFATAGQADARTVGDLLGEFLAVRQASLTLFRGLPPEAWTRRGTTNGRVITARCVPFLCLGHAAHHLAVIRERYASALK